MPVFGHTFLPGILEWRKAASDAGHFLNVTFFMDDNPVFLQFGQQSPVEEAQFKGRAARGMGEDLFLQGGDFLYLATLNNYTIGQSGNSNNPDWCIVTPIFRGYRFAFDDHGSVDRDYNDYVVEVRTRAFLDAPPMPLQTDLRGQLRASSVEYD